ncbi:hypothetical protein CEUSTIGMA_g12365.t1 [Chlamydomonas eustigma]|uniref:STI1 domain-containing protein n=1 Tax=Chlamydomonas eustigma TaxID=1157962 RepID=A0A250XPD4_9CHLO|nr:hypothetical protein CEUSTIGMA_g12365.t1 [Chlamydomonas eustigma]|eukprot:GAX84944.1 hypothetical protein CEUSTIGMA_g12365.t1 [Chlamydomonas eustigma]
MSVDELKAKGNAAFSAGNHKEAIDFFTQAISIDPSNHVLYSNRSASKASLKDYDGALEDAKQCVTLKPSWGKGYSRLGAAYFGLEDWSEAVKAYEQGLEHDPSNEQLLSSLKEAKAAAIRPPPSASPFAKPDFLAKLAMDPRGRAMMGQPDFMTMLRDVQTNSANMSKYIQDPRFMVMMEIAFGLKLGGGPEDMDIGSDQKKDSNGHHGHEHDAERRCMPETSTKPAAPAAAASSKVAPPPPEPEPMETEVDEEAREQKRKRAEAIKEKEAGNEAYKKKDFQVAIQHYNKAMELDSSDISFLTNRSAVYFETKQYDACIADCDEAIQRGRDIRADFKIIAKALTRKGSALMQQDKYEEAIAVFNKSLTEHRNADTLKKLNEAEKLLKDKKEKDYIDTDKCAEEREKGNQAFKQDKYPEAVQHYTEALRRGPPAVNPEAYKLYSNLAACYTKLGAYPEGVKAADKCIELEPSFVKGYSRKGALQYFMKEYDKAMETYQKGLKIEPDNAELQEGIDRCVGAISRFASGNASKEEVKERQERAMADPEVQGLLKDPVMQAVLRDFQENPKAAQKHLSSPEIMAKLNKLVAAGIIQMK